MKAFPFSLIVLCLFFNSLGANREKGKNSYKPPI